MLGGYRVAKATLICIAFQLIGLAIAFIGSITIKLHCVNIYPKLSEEFHRHPPHYEVSTYKHAHILPLPQTVFWSDGICILWQKKTCTRGGVCSCVWLLLWLGTSLATRALSVFFPAKSHVSWTCAGSFLIWSSTFIDFFSFLVFSIEYQGPGRTSRRVVLVLSDRSIPLYPYHRLTFACKKTNRERSFF